MRGMGHVALIAGIIMIGLGSYFVISQIFTTQVINTGNLIRYFSGVGLIGLGIFEIYMSKKVFDEEKLEKH